MNQDPDPNDDPSEVLAALVAVAFLLFMAGGVLTALGVPWYWPTACFAAAIGTGVAAWRRS